jgi:nudix-type nucleoside diphosphatase (YffH/AdpP family)
MAAAKPRDLRPRQRRHDPALQHGSRHSHSGAPIPLPCLRERPSWSTHRNTGRLLDQASPEQRIKQETEEETGYRVHTVRKIFDAYMSPGSVTEKLYFFVAEYEPDAKVQSGGGIEAEGEDIEVLELLLDDALQMIRDGEIVDGKTIMLLQYAKLHLFS